MRNEAAERLREIFPAGGGYAGGNDNIRSLLDEALATERRNTVERIRERILADTGDFTGYPAEWMRQRILRFILDEEAVADV